jgi:hypothetical protein
MDSKSAKRKSETIPYQAIIELWNTHAPEPLPRASLTDKRKPKIKAAWKEYPSLDWWRELFSDIALSPWHSHQDVQSQHQYKSAAKPEKVTPLNPAYTPPANPEAEQSVLGAILVRPEVLDQVAVLITSADFYREAHGRIFQAMLDLRNVGKPVDL